MSGSRDLDGFFTDYVIVVWRCDVLARKYEEEEGSGKARHVQIVECRAKGTVSVIVGY